MRRGTWKFDSDATYIIAGGFGGVGRSAIRWMVSRGARNLIVPSRSGPSTQAASNLVLELTRRDVRIITTPCNLSSAEELSSLLESCADMPRIKGCINAAMVLQVGLSCRGPPPSVLVELLQLTRNADRTQSLIT